MNHKVFRIVFVAAVALGLAGVMVRIKDQPGLRPPSPKNTSDDSLARPLASYRVDETPSPDGFSMDGANYKSKVSTTGFSIGAVREAGSRTATREFSMEFGSPRLEQGSVGIECKSGPILHPSFGVAQIDRGVLVEEYLFENRRVEQIFRIPSALGTGALRICIPVKTDLSGPVVVHDPQESGFKEPRFAKGGIAFCDGSGATWLAYHSAVVIDADGRKLALAPTHRNGEITLEVPAAFMAEAAYPVVVDPWLDVGFSPANGGLTQNGGASQRPAIAKGGGFVFAWSDDSSGNNDIYVKSWNGFTFVGYGGSDAPGGISGNSGRSVNPSIVVDSAGSPAVAWEDDTSGAISIYCKQWPHRGQGTSWMELAGSASGTGLSGTLGFNVTPSIGILAGIIPGTVTTNPTSGAVTSTPAQFVNCPVIAWSTVGEIYCSAFYPGQPARPADPAVPLFPLGQAAVPGGWYQLGLPNGVGVDSTQFFGGATVNTLGGLNEYPSLVVDAFNQTTIAWQGTGTANYEIFCQRWTRNVPAAAGLSDFQVQSNAALTGFNMLPASNFLDVTGAASAGLVSGTANPSEAPSLALDGGNNFTIAWEETESAAPPAPPGTTSQIYVARSVGGGAFGAVGTSLSVGGISNTLGRATAPSVDVGGGYIGVAWADDSNSRSSIYVRRFLIGVGPWDQVGFQGSAYPPAFLGEAAPIDGISKSASYSYQPQITMESDGSPNVIWADGAGAQFDIAGKTFVPNAPGVAVGIGGIAPTFNTTLTQTDIDPVITLLNPGPVTTIAVGDFSVGSTIWLSSRIFTETVAPPTFSLRIEFEVQPVGSPFQGRYTHRTLFETPDDPTATPGIIARIKFDGLPNHNYHWIARTIDQEGRSSPWISPGEVNGVTFRINSTLPTSAGGPTNVGTVGTTTSKSKCGLTGLEVVGLLGVLRLIRRRRSAK